VLEAGIVQQFMDTATGADKRRIREHMAREKRAWRGSDRRLMIKLSGEFHLILGEIAGNTVMLSLLRELVSRSSLIIALYQARATSPCPPNEHEQLCTALEQGSPRAVSRKQPGHVGRAVSDHSSTRSRYSTDNSPVSSRRVVRVIGVGWRNSGANA
jgi:DNA-binding GntR family transcriptional regulator